MIIYITSLSILILWSQQKNRKLTLSPRVLFIFHHTHIIRVFIYKVLLFFFSYFPRTVWTLQLTCMNRGSADRINGGKSKYQGPGGECLVISRVVQGIMGHVVLLCTRHVSRSRWHNIFSCYYFLLIHFLNPKPNPIFTYFHVIRLVSWFFHFNHMF